MHRSLTLAEPRDFVLYQQFTTFELHDFQVIDRGMVQALTDLGLKRLMPLLQFRKVRLHRHATCLLNPWLPEAAILPQSRDQGDRNRSPWRPAEPKSFTGNLLPALNPLVENEIIFQPLAKRGLPAPAVAMTDEEERELREQLARLQQEHRDLDAAIAALATAPGSDLIQVQRLKKRKLLLRDRIRAIEDQLTPDIIA